MQSRLSGFRAALARADIALSRHHVVQSDWTVAGGYLAAGELLDRDPRVTAIFAQNDMMAVGVISALHARGLRVPEDCAVVGCDDLPVSAHLVPPLTTVRIPFRETGRRAMSLLIDRIRGVRVASRLLLPTTLVVRESSAGRTGVVPRSSARPYALGKDHR